MTDSYSDNRCVFPFSGPTSNIAIRMLTSAIVYLYLSAPSNCHIIVSTRMWTGCSIRPTNHFESCGMINFKLWHMLLININLSARHCYSRHKISTVKMQQKFLPLDWESLLIYTCWMRKSDAPELLLFIYWTPNFNDLNVRTNVFLYKIPIKSCNSFLVRRFLYTVN